MKTKFSGLEIIAYKYERGNSSYCEENCRAGVNVLTNSPKISDLTKSYYFERILAQVYGTVV